ncbi:MAG: hypothetical protein GYB31_20640 [Bacteroidetes bacterium]|nr:hypothetical protein [Bacteroidota bacterium]
MRRIFISRDLDSRSPFRQELEGAGLEVIAESMVRCRAVAFDPPSLADWLFFCSPESIDFFLKGMRNIPQNYQLGVLDPETNARLYKAGLEAQFCGQGTLEKTALSFNLEAYDQQVIFVQARKARQSIYPLVKQQLDSRELVVYEYLPKEDIQIPPCDVYVFTSPLNVKNYFDRFLFPSGKKVISTDIPTTEKLAEYGINDTWQSDFSDERGLAFAVKSMFG